MNILVTTWVDAANLAIENIVREMVKRGHHVEIYAFYTDNKSIRMFSDLNIPLHNAKELNKNVIKQFDIAFTAESAMRGLRYSDIYVFSYNNIPDTWVTDGSDFMFTMVRDRNLRWYEDCATMPIGIAKNDSIKHKTEENQILFIDAGHNPFGYEAKMKVVQMLLNICESYPSYKIVVKPRWLLSEMKNQTHREMLHLYKLIEEATDGYLPDNLILLQEHINLQELIDKSCCAITTSLSCYLDIVLRGKGCIVVDGLDGEEEYSTRPSFKNTYQAARDSGCCVNYKDIIKFLPNGIKCRPEHLKKRIPYTENVSSKIVDVIEYIFKNFIKKGKYPPIKNYEYASYEKELYTSPSTEFEYLKRKRLKNAILLITRTMEYVSADIDYSTYYSKLDHFYLHYPLNESGYKMLLQKMNEEKRNIYLKNSIKMMSDAIDQSILLQTYYESGKIEEILTMDKEKILCLGPYNFYLGLIFKKWNQTQEAMVAFKDYLFEANSRSYNKYPQECDGYIREAYNYILMYYNGFNIEVKDFAILYLFLENNRDTTLIPYSLRKKAHNMLLQLAQNLEKTDEKLSYDCLKLFACNEYHYNIRERDKKIKTLNSEIILMKGKFTCKAKEKLYKFFKLIKGGLQCFKEHGVQYTINRIVEKIEAKVCITNIAKIWNTYYNKVIKGYLIYEKLQNYFHGAELLLSAPSRGDAYILGSMLHEYILQTNIQNAVFIVWSEASKKIAELFQIDNIQVVSDIEFKSLYNLLMFDSSQIIKIRSMHFHVFYRHTAILGYLMGLHDFNLYSLSCAYLGLENHKYGTPIFQSCRTDINNLFSENRLSPSKTILISPYAKTIRPIPMTFWISLSEKLKKMGYQVCTNVAGNETPIPGTSGIFIPFSLSVPFLNQCAGTIGLRSGFQDVSCSAKCIKISLVWENNPTPFLCCSVSEAFSLSHMYGYNKQFDYIYAPNKESDLIETITEKF